MTFDPEERCSTDEVADLYQFAALLAAVPKEERQQVFDILLLIAQSIGRLL